MQDVRLGGLQARIAAAGRRISAWLTGETDRIDELEAERLPYDTDWEAEATHENRWTNIISASNIT